MIEEPSVRKRPSANQPLVFALLLIVGMFIGTNLGDRNLLKVNSGTVENANKLVSLIDFIEDNYVDSVDKQKLIDDAIASVLGNLDPHSYYLSSDDMLRERERMRGEFGGVGIEFLILRDSLMVVKPIAGGPSESGGIQAGDRIVTVNGESISGKALNSDVAQKLLKGARGTKVKVGVYRKGFEKILEFEIERGNIPIESLVASFIVSDSIGYIKLERFAERTYDEFMAAAEVLQDSGCKKLILDLRGNGGGLLGQAASITEEFLPQNLTIVKTQGLHSGSDEIKSTKRGRFVDMELAVLIDQSSASASEIVAGALQDWDRSITIGRRSFGKGLVQHEMEMADNSALRLTVARYYTPTGRCIQRPYGDSVVYENDFHERMASGELLSEDSVRFPDSLKFRTPKGRTVYGGGGIMPDVFVPMDSIYFSGLLSDIAYSGIIRDYCFEYVEQNRATLSNYQEMQFIRKFEVSDQMVNRLLEKASRQDIELQGRVLKKIAPQIKRRIKAQLARNLFGDNATYRVLLEDDADFERAMKELSSEASKVILPKKSNVRK
jgi:carboxyl-terminal processing protease